VDLRESAAGGFAVLASLKIAGTIVARLSAIALALLLTPSDFGIFAIATFFVGLLILLADFGLGTELVRRPASPPGTLETAFTIRLVLAVIIVALTPILGYAMGMAYQDMRLASLIPISSIPILLFVFTFPSRTLALHRLQYGRASIPDHLGKMAAPILAIALALLGLGYWSFPFSMIAGATLAVVLALIAVPWRPVIRYDRRVAREVATLGKFIMITSLARTIAGSVDTAYLGFFAGAEMTGFYAVASSWGIYMTSNLSSLLSGVTYPIFVQVQDAKERIARGLQEVVRYYGYLATYLSAGVFILAEPFVVSILGPNWIPTIVPMRVLSVSGFLIGLATIGYDALTAVGMPKLVSRDCLSRGHPPSNNLVSGPLRGERCSNARSSNLIFAKFQGGPVGLCDPAEANLPSSLRFVVRRLSDLALCVRCRHRSRSRHLPIRNPVFLVHAPISWDSAWRDGRSRSSRRNSRPANGHAAGEGS